MTIIEVKPERDKEPADPWWHWFRIEIPPSTQRPEFILILIALLCLELVFGTIFGAILRSIFGWPF